MPTNPTLATLERTKEHGQPRSIGRNKEAKQETSRDETNHQGSGNPRLHSQGRVTRLLLESTKIRYVSVFIVAIMSVLIKQ